jgi:hypothetical protein
MVGTMRGLKTEAEIAGRVIEVQQASTNALAALAKSLSEQMDMELRVRGLEDEIKALKGNQADFARYALVELSHGVYAFRLKPEAANGEPEHMLCTSCYQKGNKSILTLATRGTTGDIYGCQACNARFAHRDVRQPPKVGSSDNHWEG